MKRSAIIFGVLVIVAVTLNSAYAHHQSIQACGVNFGAVIDQFVDSEFPVKSADVFFYRNPFAINDILCETNEHMANVAILVIEEDNENAVHYYFGIFHIHFSPAGKFVSSSAITPWKSYNDKSKEVISDMATAWCDLITNVYPAEKEKWSCG